MNVPTTFKTTLCIIWTRQVVWVLVSVELRRDRCEIQESDEAPLALDHACHSQDTPPPPATPWHCWNSLHATLADAAGPWHMGISRTSFTSSVNAGRWCDLSMSKETWMWAGTYCVILGQTSYVGQAQRKHSWFPSCFIPETWIWLSI